MDKNSSNGKFREDIDKKYTLDQFRWKQGYGENLRSKQKEDFEKYFETYLATSSKHMNLIQDNFQRKMLILQIFECKIFLVKSKPSLKKSIVI